MSIEVFEVGGCVRDSFMGRKSKDVDFTVVAPSFEDMRQFVVDSGLEIVVDTPEFYTIRAVGQFFGQRGGFDFVWARKDGEYTDGRRPDSVSPGTLFDDLARRDFTMNAIARAADGTIIDPYDGRGDIDYGIIKAVGTPLLRFREDGLRVMRAIRFAIMFDFTIDRMTFEAMTSWDAIEALSKVAVERIQIELERAFQHDTLATMEFLSHRLPPEMLDVIFRDGLRLSATLKS